MDFIVSSSFLKADRQLRISFVNVSDILFEQINFLNLFLNLKV